MKFFQKVFAIVSVIMTLSIPTTALAECKSVLRYVNGVMNFDQIEARKVSSVLEKALAQNTAVCVSDPLFNPSQKLLMDLSETYKLKFNLETGFLQRIKDGFIAGWHGAWDILIKFYSGQQLDPYNYKELTDSMYATIKADLVAGKGVILVSHSEGNLFALELKKMAKTEGYADNLVTIVYIAPPTKVLLDALRQSMVLSFLDRVIGTLTGVNKPNFVPDTSTTAELGHGMLAVYMNPDVTGTFTTFYCEKKKKTARSVILDSIGISARCQFGPCVSISFSNGEC